MNKLFVLLFAAGFSMLSAPGAQSQTAGATRSFEQPISINRPDHALFNEAVLYFANQARSANGRQPLQADTRLVKAAADHAANMAQLRTHSHRLPVAGQGELAQRMHRQGVRYRTAGENIGMEKVYRMAGRPISARATGCNFTYADTAQPVPAHSYASLAQAAVARWMASPRHREALLSTNFRRIGSGYSVDPAGPACGDVYLAQNFAD